MIQKGKITDESITITVTEEDPESTKNYSTHNLLLTDLIFVINIIFFLKLLLFNKTRIQWRPWGVHSNRI